MGKIPKFKTIQEEAEYWDNEDVTDHFDELEEVDISELPMKKPLSHVMSIRLDKEDMIKLSELARSRGIGITTMARMLVKQGLNGGKGQSISNLSTGETVYLVRESDLKPFVAESQSVSR